MTVVPREEPPVGQRARPFIFFSLRSMEGSSQEPSWAGVEENGRTCCCAGAGATVGRCGCDVIRVGRRADRGDILSPWRAWDRRDEVVGFIILVVVGGRQLQVLLVVAGELQDIPARPERDSKKLGGKTSGWAR